MNSPPTVPPTSLSKSALSCRREIQEGRSRVEKRFREGLPSVQTAAALTDLFDNVITQIWTKSLEAAEVDGIRRSHLDELTLVAHGGLGRRDLSPYSDADLMLLSTRTATNAGTKVAGRLIRDLTDSGLEVGFSVRTAAEARSLAWKDIKIYTSLTESRFLAGNENYFERYFDRFRITSRRRRGWLNESAVQTRREERSKWGETNFLLRPNVKRSLGGLRDIQLIRWLGFASYGETRLDRLHDLGALTEEDLDTLRRAHSFMLRLRHELHFRAGRGQDVLDRQTQLEIAEAWGYRGQTGVLPVEDFMQDYFEHTSGVLYVTSSFSDEHRARSRTIGWMERLLSRRIDDSIRMGPTSIWVRTSLRRNFARRLPDVMRLMTYANEYRRRIAHPTWQAIRQAMQERPIGSPDRKSVELFLKLLSQPGRLASLLRRLHELRILEQLIPAVRRCRGLLQFNAYHKFTVDAHCILAVEAATKLQDSNSPMGNRYRRIKDKTILHLALLIHDLGKGYDEDHSEVGRRIAGVVADSFELDREDKETLQWLIHKHLLINEVAFRHDLNDGQVVHHFAAEVGSIRRLELLLVHTVADLEAVGPDVLNDWKMSLIEDLYQRTRRYFDTGNLPGENESELDTKRAEIKRALQQAGTHESIIAIVDHFPLSLLRHQDSIEVADELCRVGDWFEGGGICFCSAHPDPISATVRVTVVMRLGQLRVGAFARITAVMSNLGLQIRRANIETIADDLLWDNFWVHDPDHTNLPPPSRIDTVCSAIRELLAHPEAPLPPVRRTWKIKGVAEPDSVNLLPTKVIFDNNTFDHQTILSLFTYDRNGLLSTVAGVLSRAGVSIQFAKIDTHLDQIADVFYVTDPENRPILDRAFQNQLRESIIASIGQL